MHLLLYDGSFTGLLTAIFEIYERKLNPVNISKAESFAPDVFAKAIRVTAEEKKANRVWKGLERKLSIAALHNFYACFLSELPSIEKTMLCFSQHVFSNHKNVESDFGFLPVLEISQTARKVFREKHRMEAFVRFKLTADNIYYASISPDYNVLPLIATHFKDRYADQNWIIYDRRRHFGIHYDMQTFEVKEIVFQNEPFFHLLPSSFNPSESLYELLWKDYFQHVNIPDRKTGSFI